MKRKEEEDLFFYLREIIIEDLLKNVKKV